MKGETTMRRTSFVTRTFTAIMTTMAFGALFTVGKADAFTLTPITTGFNNPIGIDHHHPTNKVVMSVNYSSGLPYNFELVAADGTRAQFSNISGLTEEVKIATARDDGGGMSLGGFTAGELFVGTGVPGHVARISSDGSFIQNPWVILPGEGGLMRGSLHVDRTGLFGGDLIVVTTAGRVWRVTSSGTPTPLANLFTHLEGVTTVPNDQAKYGPWAGKILAGAEGQDRIYSIDPQGNTQFWTLGIKPEDIDIIPANENFFGVDFGGATLWGAPPSEFAGMVGDVLIAQEFPGILWHVKWDAASNSFQTTLLAQVSQWEHITFSTAGIVQIPPVEDCANGIDDDGDGLVDCADPDCANFPGCIVVNTPPDCSGAQPSLSELWPPNHTMVGVNILGVTDPDGDPVTITITGITQDEPKTGTGLGSGNTCPDGAGVGTSTALVRAERAGTRSVPGNGRVYEISFKASDGKGGECTGAVTVCVPHDMRPGHVCIDDGQVFDSTTCP